MNNYRGIIIEESLENKDVLKELEILSTKVEVATEKHRTPWVKQWTLHDVIIPEDKAQEVAEEISQSLDTKHNWYADYKNKTHHYIIFSNKVFYIDRNSMEEYSKASEYGISLGIPEYQVDFHPEISEWER